MNDDNVTIAKTYYTAMKEKNAADMGKYLAPDVYYTTPLAKMTSKEEALTAAQKLFPLFKTLTIHKIFSSGDQVVVIFDLEFLPPIGNIPIAAVLTIHNKLISKIEMFYDPRPILAKKDEIFSK
jgi:SnoaL-like domain